VLRAAQERSLPDGALAAYARDVSRRAPLTRDAEQRLFVRYNYLKFRAATLRDALDKYQPEAGLIDRIETCLRRAVAIKQTLAEANLRLVFSVAIKHTGGARRGGEQRLLDLINTGNVTLLQAIDSFDVSQGNRFSTYLTYALMRSFARSEGDEASDRRIEREAAAERIGIERALAAADDPALAALESADYIDHALPRLLDSLSARERLVIERRFGLSSADGTRTEPQTLGEVAAALGVSDERVRQIEQRAIRKLRAASGVGPADSGSRGEPEEGDDV
jgi:RNA polymerase sigma factor (sigma-70 family)